MPNHEKLFETPQERLRRRLQRYRLPLAILFLTFGLVVLSEIVLRMLMLSSGMDGDLFYAYRTNAQNLISVIGVLASAAAFLNKYLSVGEDKPTKSINEVAPDNTIDNLLNASIRQVEKDLREEIGKLQESVQKTRDSLLGSKSDALSAKEKEELIYALKGQVLSSASDTLLDELKENTSRLVDAGTRDRLERHFARIMKRLSVEIGELGKRAKVNLVIGSITALAGVAIFTLFVFNHVSSTPVLPTAPNTSLPATSYLATEFAPRISLVIVIELFAYFFLGLYRNNLSEIKYFHNELTNVESRYVALEEAIASTDKDMIKEILKEMSKTERNFLLKKGETTLSLEDKRLTAEEQRGIINTLTSTISGTKNNQRSARHI